MISSTRPSPTWFGTTWLSRIHFFASGIATVSASRLCISTTSTPRSRIFCHEVEVVALGVVDPQDVVEQQVVAVGRRQALMRAARRADHDLAQLADLRVDAELGLLVP